MATTYLTPGVYIEEIDRGPKPIQGVGTNVTAFIGFTEKAEDSDPENNLLLQSVLGKAQMITNLSQYERQFGRLCEGAYLPYAIRGFFENGGVRCYVISIRAMKALPGQAVLYARDPKNPADAAKDGPPSLLIHTKDSVPSGAEVKVTVRWENGQTRPNGQAGAGSGPNAVGAPTAQAPKPEAPKADAPKADETTPSAAPGTVGDKIAQAPTPVSGQATSGQGGGTGSAPPNNASGGNGPKADFWLKVEYIVKDPETGKELQKISREEKPVLLDTLPLLGEPERATANGPVLEDVKVWRLTKAGPSGPALADRMPKPSAYTLLMGSPKLDLELFEAGDQKLLTTTADEKTVQEVFSRKSIQIFEGSEPQRKSIGALEALDDVNLVCVPDLMMAYEQKLVDADGLIAVQKAVLGHCERSHYRFAILDAPPDKQKPKDIYDWRMTEANLDSAHGALYYPWIKIQDPVTNKSKFVPPSGHMAGIYARSDSERGVHKAPANEQVRFCVDVKTNVTKGEQELLNPVGINCIRSFSGRGIRVWGARTLANDPAWRYINVRRLFNYVEESIERSTQWIVFEPNDAFLWARVRRDITAFLRTVWLSGALFGGSPQESFYVKCDAETNPRELLDLGQMICEIGMAPVKPAEFVIFRFSQWAGPSTE